MSAVKCLLKVYEHGIEGVVFCALLYYLFWGEALIDAWHSSQACSCLTMLWRTVMSLFRMIPLKLLLVCDKRVMPRQWLQSHVSLLWQFEDYSAFPLFRCLVNILYFLEDLSEQLWYFFLVLVNLLIFHVAIPALLFQFLTTLPIIVFIWRGARLNLRPCNLCQASVFVCVCACMLACQFFTFTPMFASLPLKVQAVAAGIAVRLAATKGDH